MAAPPASTAAPDASAPRTLPGAHLHSSAEVARRLGVDLDQGLAADEVTERRARHGPNRLPEAPPRSWASRLLAPFRDFMILVLLAAALLSGVVGDAVDALAILVILLLNAAISIAQEWRADRAMEALGRLATPHATVHRDGQPALVEADHLVPGDVVLLEAGNVVPADLRLHRVAQLRVDESALTGESLSVEKHSAHLPQPAEGDYALGDLVNMAFKGTIVTHGRATGVAVATGRETALGRVAALLQDGDRSTPLQRRLEAFGRRLALVVLAICALVFTTGVLRGEPVLLMALTAISLAVAAIPEALPAVVTVLLALGARRLARANALVRRLPSVETLGSVTAICTDKTGTLTQNRMQVQTTRSWGASDERLWTAAVLCNDAHRGAQGWVGDPTETAITEHADALGLDAAAIQQRRPRLHEHPFDSERKCMSTVHAGGAPGLWQLFFKGAPEAVLARCSAMLGADGVQALDGAAVLQAAQVLARQGMRVLAVAERDGSGDPAALDASALEQELVLLGLVALRDPPRPEARAAVAECRAAGIRPIMITGDHPQTALAIARDLGIAEADADDAAVLTGAEIARLADAALAEALERVSVFARVDPAQKIRIVAALQAQGEVVAMTGDGVNDAPALKAADIGVAMGRSGTDVAREAASLVLLDDNFATIVRAVREGRRIFDNIRKFIRYAMSGNSAEIWVLFLAPLIGLPIPLLPIQILWVNLVTDGLPGLALAAEPAERGVMQRPPRPPRESVFAHGLWQHTLWVGLFIAGLCLGVQAWALAGGTGGPADGFPHWQTMVFTVLTLAQMAHVLAIRSETESLVTQGLLSNRPLLYAVASTLVLQLATIYVPWLQPVFRTAPLSGPELALCFACAGAVFGAVEVEKAWRRRLR
jgi:Ca2+-transporting ATPase